VAELRNGRFPVRQNLKFLPAAQARSLDVTFRTGASQHEWS